MRAEGRFPSPHRLDLLVCGKLYVAGRLIDAAVGVREGKIVWIGKEALAPPAERVMREGNLAVLPGMVDMHVHVRGLELRYKEDWSSASLSALAGGVTFLADMPNTRPQARSLEVLKMKEEEARAEALVDYGFYAGIPESADELRKMAEFGVLGLKVYPEDLFNENLLDVLAEAARLDLLVVVHAEDPLWLKIAGQLHPREMKMHGLLRPVEAEVSAVRLLKYLSLRLGLKVHFTHVSSAAALREVIAAKLESGSTADVAIHHLLLDSSAVASLGGLAKVNPPLRSREDAEALKRALKTGILDAVITDHAPHSLDEKMSDEYDKIPPGFPGLEICLPLLLTLIKSGELPMSVLEAYSKRPARLLGIPKGEIAVGLDADLVLVNLGERWTIRGANLWSKAKYTPFEGKEVVGKVEKVLIRGTPVYEKGEVLVDGGFGRRYRS